MAKAKSVYSCTECGATSPKWAGQCPGCSGWNTLVETVAEQGSGAHRFASLAGTAQVQTLADIRPRAEPRLPTGLDEFDRVLGGGLVPGGVVLIGGDPGIGKSTLLLQALAQLASRVSTLYITGEESGEQVALRAQRLALDASGMQLLAEINLEKIAAVLTEQRPRVVVVDSIQTVYSEQLTSAPGSVAQVRECAAQLTRAAKQAGHSLILVGHVTKEGTLAGPRVLEHIVDTVLYFEGETSSSFRLVRAFKNRYGAVNELGVFAMTERGLRGVSNPSAMFLSQHGQPVSGFMRDGDAGRHAAAAGRDPGAGGQRARQSAPSDGRAGRGAPGHAAGGAAPARRRRVRRSGCVRQCGRRRQDRRTSGRSGGAAGHRVFAEEPPIAAEAGRVRRSRPGRRDPSRRRVGQERLREAAKLGFTHALIPKANAPKQKIDGLTIIAVERIEEAFAKLRELE
jgi:DNA repair protein RadA/Sms